MKLFPAFLVLPALVAVSARKLGARDCNQDNCLRAMIHSASDFCSTYTASPTSSDLPAWATACSATDVESRILSGCGCLPTATPSPTSACTDSTVTLTDVFTSVYTSIYTSVSVAISISTSTATETTTYTAPTSSSIPTIYMCGDSTMAKGGGGGWGQYLQYSFDTSKAAVVNDATAGRSARSYTREGRFAAVAAVVKPGDWVVIEFGHNDGGSPLPSTQDNGRADCPGFGNQTCTTVYLNVTEVVQTYPTYLVEAGTTFLSKGAKVIISSPTSDNPWESGNFTYSPNRFSYFAWLAVSELGGPAAGAYFVPHGPYAAQAMQNLGAAVVNANYPLDHTHTGPYLASVVAQSYVLGLKCGTSGLADLVANATSRIEGSVLGTCILANSTLPI